MLAGNIPVGGRCDVTTLAELAGISRAALYRTHRALKDDFDRSLFLRRTAGEVPDPREARIATLKQTVDTLTTRLREREATITELREHQRQVRSQLLVQHEEILTLRAILAQRPVVLPTASDQKLGGDTD
ncbi:hypothetical protein AOZ06_05085 [Kibdelosporangium phytohabitans]|uniref:Uncharacterized protein n=1 Tax=Kibdelosporangium phytohabitans TaxID=860235 RepID=A0A0N9HJZ7_9PSEU|nr:hypothetical protein AOZ06_05085 [Kibdelosporangium phytohabitans]